MEPLHTSGCVPCRGGLPPLTPEEIRLLSPEVPGWHVVERDSIARLEREFTFPDFRGAMALAVRVGELADALDHHPDLHVAWGRLRIETWTHAIKGLHRNDFVLAARIDRLGTAGG